MKCVNKFWDEIYSGNCQLFESCYRFQFISCITRNRFFVLVNRLSSTHSSPKFAVFICHLKWALPIDDYAKNGRPGEVWLLCSFYSEPLPTWIKTIVNKFAISNHTALILGVHVLRSYLKLICQYELHSLPNRKVSDAKDHGKNYIKIRLPLVLH